VSFGRSRFECIDTTPNIDSCGGCVSEGMGQDCSANEGVEGVTCSRGRCLITLCKPGWVVSQGWIGCEVDMSGLGHQGIRVVGSLKAERFWGL